MYKGIWIVVKVVARLGIFWWLEPSAPGMPPPPPDILGYPSMAPPSYAAAIADAPPAYEDHEEDHNEDQDDDYDHSTFSGSAYVPVYTYARPHQVM